MPIGEEGEEKIEKGEKVDETRVETHKSAA
jgi:hypothetical protein